MILVKFFSKDVYILIFKHFYFDNNDSKGCYGYFQRSYTSANANRREKKCLSSQETIYFYIFSDLDMNLRI